MLEMLEMEFSAGNGNVVACPPSSMSDVRQGLKTAAGLARQLGSHVLQTRKLLPSFQELCSSPVLTMSASEASSAVGSTGGSRVADLRRRFEAAGLQTHGPQADHTCT